MTTQRPSLLRVEDAPTTKRVDSAERQNIGPSRIGSPRGRVDRVLLTADPILPVPPIFYGGIERIIAMLCEEYRRKGYSVGLLALGGSSVGVDALYHWPRGPDDLQGVKSWWRQQDALSRAVKDFRPDVLHSFSRLAYLGRHLVGRLPKVMSYQRPPSLTTTKWASRLAGDTLVFTGCSAHIAHSGSRSGGDWRAIPNFIDPSTLDYVAEVAEDAPLVFLSRLERIKGVHTAIAIARRAQRRLIIAGNQVDSPEGLAYWRKEIEPHLRPNEIEYVGAVNDQQKNALLGQAAAMLVPIEWEEPFGIVFAESLACGTPVISTPRGAVPEIIEDGKHGYIVNSIEEGALAVDRLRQISRAACRAHVEANFSISVVCERYISLYEELAARSTCAVSSERAGFPGRNPETLGKGQK